MTWKKPDSLALTVLAPTAPKALLSLDEATELAKCEAIVSKGYDTFYEVGMALAKISNLKLYRDTDETFDDYVKRKWEMSRGRAYQLMGAAQVQKVLSTIVDKDGLPMPVHESQVRPLVGLKEEDAKAAYKAAVDGAKSKKVSVTAKLVAVEAKKYSPAVPAKAVTETRKVKGIKAPAKSAAEAMSDVLKFLQSKEAKKLTPDQIAEWTTLVEQVVTQAGTLGIIAK